MCKFKSMILTKDRVYCPDHDEHSKMIEEMGIRDDKPIANFVKIEITPADGDPFAPISTWKYRVDQDNTPEWYCPDVDEPRARAALQEWADKHIFIGVDNLTISEGAGYCIKDCKDVQIAGSATVGRVAGSATVGLVAGSATVGLVAGSATVEWVAGSATVKRVDGSATVGLVTGSATVGLVAGSATVGRASGYSTITSSQYGPWIKKASLVLSESATFKDCYTKTIYQSGGWKSEEVEDGKIA